MMVIGKKWTAVVGITADKPTLTVQAKEFSMFGSDEDTKLARLEAAASLVLAILEAQEHLEVQE